MTTPRRILIRAGHVIAFDGRGHRLLREGAVVLEGDRILHVGPQSEGRFDRVTHPQDETGAATYREHRLRRNQLPRLQV